jgi:hypothetical protein
MIGDHFKVIENAIKGVMKKKVLEEKPLIMNTCFGPGRADDLTRRVRLCCLSLL